jgi:3-hydroxybutyryl-CoA dehydrogenase
MRGGIDMTGEKGVVIGGGTMGAGIAAMFVAGSSDVDVIEPNEATRAGLVGRVEQAAREIGRKKPLGKVRALAAIEEIDWSGVTLVVEAVLESLELKRQVFAALDAAAPRDIPITSNSSGFPITKIADGLKGAGRMLGLHFFMPAHLVPCVEVICGERSDMTVAERVMSITGELGKKPVLVRKDIPGFLANRLQAAIMREALHLVEEGYASIEDIDTVSRYSFGFRLAAAGPLLQKDISGLRSVVVSHATIYPSLSNATEPSRILRDLVAAGKSGVQTREGFYKWSDETAAAELARYDRAIQKALAILREEDEAAP